MTAAATPGEGADSADAAALTIRPPLQRRTREAWTRVLDAGVALLEDGGYEAFTIAAVCDRAQVAPTAIYARADTKDALFLAVYEHGMDRVRADQQSLVGGPRWDGLAADELARTAVFEVAGIFRRHEALLRTVVLISGAHPEIHRRGALSVAQLGDQFTALLLNADIDIDHPDPETAIRAVFGAVFATLVLRTTYGSAFASPFTDERSFLESLATMVQRYLFRPITRRA